MQSGIVLIGEHPPRLLTLRNAAAIKSAVCARPRCRRRRRRRCRRCRWRHATRRGGKAIINNRKVSARSSQRPQHSQQLQHTQVEAKPRARARARVKSRISRRQRDREPRCFESNRARAHKVKNFFRFSTAAAAARTFAISGRLLFASPQRHAAATSSSKRFARIELSRVEFLFVSSTATAAATTAAAATAPFD